MEDRSEILRSNEDPDVSEREIYDLKDHVPRSSKLLPRPTAEGGAGRHQEAGFQKYLNDALAESNETQASMCHAWDIYFSLVDEDLSIALIKEYHRSKEITLKIPDHS